MNQTLPFGARWLSAAVLTISLQAACGSNPADSNPVPPGSGAAGEQGTGGAGLAGGTGAMASGGTPSATTSGGASGTVASGANGGMATVAGASGSTASSGGANAAGGSTAGGSTNQAGSSGGQGRAGTSASGGRAATGGSSGGAAGGRAATGGAAGSNSGGPASSYNPCPAAGTDCAILPLGDSITDGFTVRGGYRIPFFQDDHTAGKHFTFVGSLVNGPTTVAKVPFPQHHEGHSAHTMYDAPNATTAPRLGISRYIPTSIPKYKPDIVLLMIGTNDVDGNVDLTNAPSRLGMLIDSIIALDAHILVVVAQITPTMMDDLNMRIQTFNAGIPAVVKSRAAAGKHVLLVDMYGAFVKDPAYKTKYLQDRLHPNATGYQVMSDVWNTAIHDLLH